VTELGDQPEADTDGTPIVLFLCVHNAGATTDLGILTAPNATPP
jgi:hypothetical protein